VASGRTCPARTVPAPFNDLDLFVDSTVRRAAVAVALQVGGYTEAPYEEFAVPLPPFQCTPAFGTARVLHYHKQGCPTISVKVLPAAITPSAHLASQVTALSALLTCGSDGALRITVPSAFDAACRGGNYVTPFELWTACGDVQPMDVLPRVLRLLGMLEQARRGAAREAQRGGTATTAASAWRSVVDALGPLPRGAVRVPGWAARRDALLLAALFPGGRGAVPPGFLIHRPLARLVLRFIKECEAGRPPCLAATRARLRADVVYPLALANTRVGAGGAPWVHADMSAILSVLASVQPAETYLRLLTTSRNGLRVVACDPGSRNLSASVLLDMNADRPPDRVRVQTFSAATPGSIAPPVAGPAPFPPPSASAGARRTRCTAWRPRRRRRRHLRGRPRALGR
jgi:hypothetical protein